MVDDALAAYIAKGYKTVPGWTHPSELALFALIDDVQREHGVGGDLLEIGSYLGRVAILFGYFRRGAEELVASDLFDEDAPTGANARENQFSYVGLTEGAFRSSFERFHPPAPRVIAGASEHLGSQVEAHSCRLIHVDGSHQFDIVTADIALSRTLAQDEGAFVVVDDLVSRHTPGVPAAMWHAVGSLGLIPLVCSSKLYATWNRTPVHDAWTARVATSFGVTELHIHGHRVLRVHEVDARTTAQRLMELSPARLVSAVRARLGRAHMR